MKILWLTLNITVIGGVEQVICGLSNQFCQEFGYEVEIVSTQTDQGDPFFPIDPRIQIRHWGLHWQEQTRSSLSAAVQEIMQKSDADILITCHAAVSTAALLNKRFFHGKIIVTQHCQFAYEPLKRRLLNAAIFHLADQVVVLTQDDRNHYRQLGLRTHVIPNAIFNDSHRSANSSSHMIITSGRFEHVKGFDRLIQAFSKIAPAFPDWKLCICGDGTEHDALKAQVKQYQIEQQVLFPGFITDMDSYLSKASIFAYSSYSEGFPLSILDAMAHGLPMVSFDLPAIQEITTPQCTEIVPQDDLDGFAAALKKLMGSQHLREQMGEAARERSRQYSLPCVASQWQTLFDQLLN